MKRKHEKLLVQEESVLTCEEADAMTNLLKPVQALSQSLKDDKMIST